MTILDEILAHKRDEVAAAKRRTPPAEMARLADQAEGAPRGFARALRAAAPPRIVAEVKRRSPSKGEIRADFDPAAIAKAYGEAGAAAISVLTDERYFGGRLEFVALAKRAAPVPILRKDFVVDGYQIDEAWAAGADAVLLIVAALPEAALRDLAAHAAARGVDALVEVHDERELDAALAMGASLVGVNNRDLHSFHTDLAVTERLAKRVPRETTLVSESGIFTHEDVRRLEAAGAHAFLVGESLMRESDPGAALRRLRGAAA